MAVTFYVFLFFNEMASCFSNHKPFRPERNVTTIFFSRFRKIIVMTYSYIRLSMSFAHDGVIRI